MLKLCHYIKDDNKLCNAAAKRGELYCRHHLELLRRKMRMARKRRQLLGSFLRKNPLNSRAAVKQAKQRIIDGIPAGGLDNAQSRLLASAFRLLDRTRRGLSQSVSDPSLKPKGAPAGARTDV